LHLLPPERRSHRPATTYGVGQLLAAARARGAKRILLGLGGTASIDGGTGALLGLGYRLTVADGSGLKIGGEDLARVARVSRGWAADWDDVEVVLLADVDVVLAEAAPLFGPQKGVTPAEIPEVGAALDAWAEVAERDLPGSVTRHDPGTGAAGGLGYGLARALPRAHSVVGAAAVAELVGLPAALHAADLVVTGEGRLDATSAGTKVVGHLVRAATVPVVAVVGGLTEAGSPPGVRDVEQAAPHGPGPDPAAEVGAAAARLATRTA
jgi:glycerate 2-kinase